ncbi:MAG: hypothetical protein J7559_05120, partial [Cohnella sp.]|nr:hypothetical protein [Cohnella sp.]
MPDWSYQTLFRPLLFRMPARAARKLTLSLFGAVGRMPWGSFVIRTLGHQEPSPLLETGWSKTPVGLAGTVDPTGIARRGLAQLGFGFVEIGPVTVAPIVSDSPILVDADKNRIYYPEPLENDGAAAVAIRLSSPGHAIPQYVRIAAMPGSSADAAELQLVQLAESLTNAGAAGFYVDSNDARLLRSLAAWMQSREPGHRRPLFLTLSPNLPEIEVIQILGELDLTAWRGVVIGGGAFDSTEHSDYVLGLIRIIRGIVPKDWIVKAASGVEEPSDAVAFAEAGV